MTYVPKYGESTLKVGWKHHVTPKVVSTERREELRVATQTHVTVDTRNDLDLFKERADRAYSEAFQHTAAVRMHKAYGKRFRRNSHG